MTFRVGARRRALAAAMTAAVLVVAMTSGAAASGLCLELVAKGSNQVVWSQTILQTDQVRLAYQHSLYRVPQEEVYDVSQGALSLAEMRFGSYDALAYYDADPRGAVWQDESGWHLRPTSDRTMAPAPFRVGYTTRHQILLDDETVEVAALVKPGTTAILRLRSRDASKQPEACVQ